MEETVNAVKDVTVHGEYPATHCNKRAPKGWSPMTAEIAQKWFCPFDRVSLCYQHYLSLTLHYNREMYFSGKRRVSYIYL